MSAFSPFKRAVRRGLAGLVLAGGGAGCGYLGARLGVEQLFPYEMPVGAKLALVVLMPVWWFVAVAVHEGGHLLGGRLAGGRFQLLMVGPVKLQRTPRGLRLGWNRSFNLGGGLAYSQLPPGPRMRRGAIALVAGGPLASVVLAAAGIVVAWALGLHLAAQIRVPALLAMLHGAGAWTGLMAALTAVVTLLPLSAGGMRTDGLRLWHLLRGGEAAELELATFTLTQAVVAGVRPREWDAALVARLAAAPITAPSDAGRRLFAVYQAMDAGRVDEALGWLAPLREDPEVMDLVRRSAAGETAWLLAQHGGDVAEARRWLEKCRPLPLDPALPLRAEAAILLREGRPAEAAAQAAAALAYLHERALGAAPAAWIIERVEALAKQAAAAGAASSAVSALMAATTPAPGPASPPTTALGS